MGQEKTNKRKDKKMTTTAEKWRDPNRHYKHCNVDGHTKEKCWKIHQKLRPKWLKSKGKSKGANEKKEAVESTYDMDKVVVCTTLQQPKVSGDKQHYSKSNFK